jgi:hypothetical protein
VPKKELVLIASRAISLYLVFWSLGNLANVPSLAFAISHYAGLPASVGPDGGEEKPYAHNYVRQELNELQFVQIILPRCNQKKLWATSPK